MSLYRLVYYFDGVPWSARYEADDLDMAVAQANLEDFRTKMYPLAEGWVATDDYGDSWRLIY